MPESSYFSTSPKTMEMEGQILSFKKKKSIDMERVYYC